MVLMVCKPTIVLVYLRLGLEPCAAPWRFAYRHGIYVDDVLGAVYGATMDECVEICDNNLWSSVFTQYRPRKGCPCQDLLQPCWHKEAVDSSLENFNLQNFILALVLTDDDIVKSAVNVESDRKS